MKFEAVPRLEIVETVEVEEAMDLKKKEPKLSTPIENPIAEEDLSIFHSQNCGDNPLKTNETTDKYLQDVKENYTQDPLFSKVLLNPDDHPAFTVKDNIIYTKNRGGEKVICIPKGTSSDTGRIHDRTST